MLVDTGILVAAANRKERRHRTAVEILASGRDLLVTDAILSEAHHLIAQRVGWKTATAFLGSIDNDLDVEPSTVSDRERAVLLCRTYLDARLDYTDALTIAIAERLGETVIATLDDHFRLVRPSHIEAFEIAP